MKTSLLFPLTLLFFFSCSEEDNGPKDLRPVISFKGTVTDFDTGEPVVGTDISHMSEFGCTTPLKIVNTTTLSDGSFTIVYRKDIDSLVAVTGSAEIDTSYLFYNLSTSDEFLLEKQKKQGPREILHPRDGNLQPNQEDLSIKVVKAGVLELDFEDVEYEFPESFIEIKFYDKDDLEISVGYVIYYSYSERIEHPGHPDARVILPANKDLIMKWVVKEGNDTNYLEDFKTVAQGEDKISLNFRESVRYQNIISF